MTLVSYIAIATGIEMNSSGIISRAKWLMPSCLVVVMQFVSIQVTIVIQLVMY